MTDQPVAFDRVTGEGKEAGREAGLGRPKLPWEPRRCRVIAGNETDLVWIMDLSCRTTSLTASAHQRLGRRGANPDSLVETASASSLHEISDKIFAEIQDIASAFAKDASGPWTVNIEFIGRDGEMILTDTRISTLYTGDGCPCGLVCVTRHVTGPQQEQNLFRTLADSSPIGVYILQEGTFKFVNYQFEHYAKYTQEELLGADAMSFVIPEDRDKVRHSARAMLKGERSSPYEFRFMDKQGRTRWVMESVASIQHDGRRATLGSFMDISELKRVESDLRDSEARLRLLTQRIFEIQEEERARFARDLHDELGQDIVFLKMKAESLASRLKERPELHEQAVELVEVAEKLKTTARRIAANVGPGLLDSLGLVRAVEWYGEEFERRTGLSCPVDVPTDDIPLPRATALAAYRILQEGLTNVWKHSGASQVCVQIGKDCEELVLKISDNGVGIGAKRLKTGPSLGLLSMSERARLAGGILRVSSQPGRGTDLALRLPITAP